MASEHNKHAWDFKNKYTTREQKKQTAVASSLHHQN
jgi:hypothetical protein